MLQAGWTPWFGAAGFAVAGAIGAATGGCAARPPPVVVVEVTPDDRALDRGGAPGGVKATANVPSNGSAAVEAPVDPKDEAAVVRAVLASIREISPAEHAMKRRGLDLFLDHNELFTRTARIVPHMVNGKVLGMHMFGIRPDGVFAKLGFENGDRIEHVMGRPLTDPESALAIYAAMRGETDIEIEITRRGSPWKLVVHIE